MSAGHSIWEAKGSLVTPDALSAAAHYIDAVVGCKVVAA